MRDWVTNVETTHYVLGSAMGPHPYPTIVRDLQRRIGDEAAAQIAAAEGRLPDLVLACVGGGSNAIGLLDRFIGEPSVRLAVAEAAGDGIATGRHAAALAGGTPGILHGSRSMMLQDRRRPGRRGALGLGRPRLPGRRAADRRAGRRGPARGRRRTDDEAVRGDAPAARTEGILPALETAHAFAVLPRLLAGAEGVGAPFSGRCASSSSGCPAGATRTSAPFGRWIEAHGIVTAIAAATAGAGVRPAPAAGTNGRPAPGGSRQLRRARADGRIGARSRTSSPAIRTRTTSLEVALAAIDAGADLLEVGLPYSRPARRRRHAPARLAGRARGGRDLRRSLAPVARIAAARPAVPIVPMGYANQLIGGGDGRDRARRSASAGAAGVIVADLTPDEGAPFERVAAEAGHRGGLPRRADDVARRRAAIAARSGGFLYCVSLVGVTGARTSLPPTVARLVREVRPSRRSRSRSGSGSSRPAHVRAIAKAGADGVIVASALVDALGPDGRDIDALTRLVTKLRAATAS